jgi:hypothetical protein
VPGARLWSHLNANRVPVYGVLLSAVVAVLITSPALVKVDIGGAPVPVAFFAVVSIGVIGLYVAFAIPIWLRWRRGSAFQPGGWTIGRHYRWMCLVAVAEIVITSVIALLPTSSLGAPWYKGFGWSSLKYVNYTPIVVLGALLILWIAWHASVKHWFTGPKTTVDLPRGMSSSDEIALEHHHGSGHLARGVPPSEPEEPPALPVS